MEKGSMLKVLENALDNLWGLLIKKDWKSLLIDYEPPTVERVYTDLPDGNRLSLHVIHPCEEGEQFFHPHPWPSAMYIFDGKYKMDIGYGAGLEIPPVITTVTMSNGSYYEMIDPNAWHSVRPIGLGTVSVMVNGPAWDRPMPKKPEKRLSPLSTQRVNDIKALVGNLLMDLNRDLF